MHLNNYQNKPVFIIIFYLQIPFSIIVLIDQIDYHFDHHVLLIRAALGNHEREGHEGIVGDSFMSVRSIEDVVTIEEPEEKHGCNAFVAIAERVILYHEI